MPKFKRGDLVTVDGDTHVYIKSSAGSYHHAFNLTTGCVDVEPAENIRPREGEPATVFEVGCTACVVLDGRLHVEGGPTLTKARTHKIFAALADALGYDVED